MPLFVALTAFNVATGGVPSARRADTKEYEGEFRQNALNFVAGEIETFRDERSELPHDLSLLDVPDFGEWRYERRDEFDYEIELTEAHVTVRFDSSEDSRAFAVTGAGTQ